MLGSRKAKNSEPDYHIDARKEVFERGAGWVWPSQTAGAKYVSVSLSIPALATINGNIANARRDEPVVKVIIWIPPG